MGVAERCSAACAGARPASGSVVGPLGPARRRVTQVRISSSERLLHLRSGARKDARALAPDQSTRMVYNTTKLCPRSDRNWPLAPRGLCDLFDRDFRCAVILSSSSTQHEHTPARTCSRRRRAPPPAARPPAAATASLPSAHERDRTRRAPRVARRSSAALRAAARPRRTALTPAPAGCITVIVRRATAAAPAAAPAAGWQRHLPSRGRRGQLQPRATPTVHDPPTPLALAAPVAAPVGRARPCPPTHGRAAAAAPICRPQAEGLPAALCGSPERAELARRVARPEAQAPSAYEPSEAPQGPAQRRLSRRRAGGRGRAQCWEQPLRTRPSLQALGERAAARESPVYIDA